MSVGTCMLLGTRVAPRCCGVSYGKAAGARLPAGIAGSPGVGTRVLPARHAWALGMLVSPRRRCPTPSPQGISTHRVGAWAGVLAEPWQQAGSFAALRYVGALFGASVEPPCHGPCC